MGIKTEDVLSARTNLLKELKRELLGPGSEYSLPDEEHEIITDLPEIRYSTGILFPQKNEMRADNNEVSKKLGVGLTDEDEVLEQAKNSTTTQIERENRNYRDMNRGDFDPETDSLDEDVALSSQNMPSSMGMTFMVGENPEKINFFVRFGTYKNVLLENCVIPFDRGTDYEIPDKVKQIVQYSKHDKTISLLQTLKRKQVNEIVKSNEIEDDSLIDALYRISNQFEKGFLREPHEKVVEIDFINGNMAQSPLICGTALKLIVLKKKTSNGLYALTALLVNTSSGNYDGRNSIFQPYLCVRTADNPKLKLETYMNRNYGNREDAEELSLQLLYRDKKVYATGHGVSVDWSVDSNGKGTVFTEYMPLREVPQVEFELVDSEVKTKTLYMKYLSDLDEADKKEKLEALRTLVRAYEKWIEKIEKKASVLSRRMKETAILHVQDCRIASKRMYEGIKILEHNESAYAAFQLSNRAMFMQRIHLDLQREDHFPDDALLQQKMSDLNYYNFGETQYKWRPFQLAFLLMSLKSMVDETCEERDLVDLIWFPTGGGKTEAYLGLTAFTIFFRRLNHKETSYGTTVIMRYTLRLLAAQQFVRAGTLICACEAIRQEFYPKKHKKVRGINRNFNTKYPTYELGEEEISIGLWIGSSHTPNKNEEAAQFISKLQKATKNDLREIKERNSKFQILKCPWCGTKLTPEIDVVTQKVIGKWGYFMKDKTSFRMCCPQEGCIFESNLPFQVVDEELYKNPPTLLFGTVDKFAMLPWRKEAGSFFASSGFNRTPELIIQDELHLISGPLGTMVGLYETAIDALCSTKGVKPKIIASTATIRRAGEQCSNLYNREVKQFPPAGIDADDSFFSKEASINKKPGRFYVGLMPAGKTKAMMEIRTIAAILQRVHMLDLPEEIKDKFWTLAVYFNSLRDLSKCTNLVEDDVKDFMRRMAQRFGKRNELARPIGSAKELTSRISTSELNETLEKLEQLEYSTENIENKKYAVNVLLASNMISVGVDVSRLNIMLLVGQPKSTSEYIQASSRIGRTYPGTAIVLYDGSKSRDRSHYEQFRSYHESFYRFVEPTGVTPFSKPARERALHAVMITLMRHRYGLSKDQDVKYFKSNMDELQDIQEFILNRMGDINGRSTLKIEQEIEETEKEMETFWEEWQDKIDRSDGEEFFYGDKYIMSVPPIDVKRLIKVFASDAKDPAKETLTSMRNVDQSVSAGMIIWE